jgi:D-glycero-alpha-D-manno-heptose-7-phosphate kinase
VVIRARAPLRVGLAGGGTDVSPYCDRFGGAVLNMTIDLYAYAIIAPAADGRVVVAAPDIGGACEILAGDRDAHDGALVLHRAVYRRMVEEFNGGREMACRITTFCDAPPGSGLGTSSTVVVALVKAFAVWLNLPLGEYEIAQLAFEIERLDVGLAGGRQDQYAAVFGGVNFMEFFAGRVLVNPLRVQGWILAELESSLVLFDSGVSRASAVIIGTQTGNLVSGRGATLDALHALKADAVRMKEFLLRGDFGRLAGVLRETWEAKKTLADGVSTARIDAVVAVAMQAGALAGKVLGAGGGGVLMFLVAPERRVEVVRALQACEGRVLPCHLTRGGAEGWRVEAVSSRQLSVASGQEVGKAPALQ